MLLGNEPPLGRMIFIERAAWNVKDTMASSTVEVMMMVFSTSLVQGPEHRVVDLREPPRICQKPQVSVDCGQVQRPNHTATDLKHIPHRERAGLMEEDLLDGSPLGCIAFHCSLLSLNDI